MADISQVVITGFGNSIPKWASEKTLSELKDEIVKIVDVIDKKQKLKKVDLKGDQKALDEHEKKLKELNKEQEDNQKKVKKHRKEAQEYWDKEKSAFDKLNSSMKGQSKTTTVVTTAVEGLGSVFKSLTSPTALIGESFGLAGLAIGKFIGYIEETAKVLTGLYDNGQVLQQGWGGLISASSKAYLSFDKFSDLVVKNGELLKSFGDDGIVKFGDMLHQTVDLAKAQKFYGMTIEQIDDYSSNYLGNLKRLGTSTRWIQENGAQAANEYIKQLTAYSQILGKSREEIAKQSQDALDQVDIQAFMYSLTDEQRKQFVKTTTQMASVFDDKFVKQVTEDAATPFAPSSPLSIAMANAGEGMNELYLSIVNMMKAGQDVTPQLQTLAKRMAETNQAGKNNLTGLTTFHTQLGEGASLYIANAKKLQDNQKNLDKLIESSAKAPDEMTARINDLVNTITMIESNWKNVMASFIIEHQKTLTDIVTLLESYANKIEEWMKEFFNPQTRDKAVAELKDGLKSLMQELIHALIDAVLDYFKPGKTGAPGSGVVNGTKYKDRDDYIQKRSAWGMGWDALQAGGSMIGSGLSTAGHWAKNVAEFPADAGMWAGNKIGQGINWARGTSSSVPEAKPKITNSPDMPLQSNTSTVPTPVPVVMDQDVTKKLQTLIDLQTINNDQNATINATALKQSEHLKAIKQNINADPNIVQ